MAGETAPGAREGRARSRARGCGEAGDRDAGGVGEGIKLLNRGVQES